MMPLRKIDAFALGLALGACTMLLPKVLANEGTPLSSAVLVEVIGTDPFVPRTIGTPIQRGQTGASVFVNGKECPVEFWRMVNGKKVYRREWPF